MTDPRSSSPPADIRTLLVLAVAVLLSVAEPLVAADEAAPESLADPAARGLAVLEAANAAMREVGVVSYDFTYTGTGGNLSRLVGHVVHDPPSQGDRHRLRATVEAHLAPPVVGDHGRRLELYADGHDIWRFDRGARRVDHGTRDGGASYLLTPLGYVTVPQLMRRGDRPLGVEIDGHEEVRWVGTERVGETLCDVVFLRFPEDSGLGDQVLSFGREDRVIRRVAFVGAGSPPFVFLFEITDLRLRLDVADDTFRLASPPPGVTVVEVDERRLAAGEPVPSWTLPTLAGGEVAMDALRGEVVVLDFWATWCPFCAAMAPHVAALARDYAERPVRVVGVNIWENGDPAAWVEEHGVGYPIAIDDGSVVPRVVELYKITGTPTTLVVGADGRLVARVPGGPIDQRVEALREAVDQALAAIGDGD